MIIWVRNIVIIFFLLSIVFAVLTLLSRQKQRTKLKADYGELDTAVSTEIDKNTFIEKGMHSYNKSLRAKLIFCVYLIPLIVIIILLILARGS